VSFGPLETGKHAGEHPSAASLYRALAEPAADDDRPGPAAGRRDRRGVGAVTAHFGDIDDRAATTRHPAVLVQEEAR
jgi:hypothetical protein